MREQIPVSLTALYAKIDGVEVGTSEALVAHSAERLRPIVEELGAPDEPWLEGHRIKVLDGNHLGIRCTTPVWLVRAEGRMIGA
jgi:hypothetical protein